MEDIQGLLDRIEALERQQHRFKLGTIHKVRDDGQFRINWGEKRTSGDLGGSSGGGEGGGGGSEGGGSGGDQGGGGQDNAMLSPWIRSGHHAGWTTENVPFKQGQTVASIGMDPEHRTALVFPFSYSQDYNPKDGDQKNDRHTYRIRDPKDQSKGQDQGGGQGGGGQQSASDSGGGGDQQQQYPKAKDDAEDVQYTRHYDCTDIKIGKKLQVRHQREKKDQQGNVTQKAFTAIIVGGDNSQGQSGGGGGGGGGGQQELLGEGQQGQQQDALQRPLQEGGTEDNQATTLYVVDGKVTIKTKNIDYQAKSISFKADTFTIDAKTTVKKDIIHEKNTYLGGEDADKPLSFKGTVDDGGYTDLGPVSQSAFTK